MDNNLNISISENLQSESLQFSTINMNDMNELAMLSPKAMTQKPPLQISECQLCKEKYGNDNDLQSDWTGSNFENGKGKSKKRCGHWVHIICTGWVKRRKEQISEEAMDFNYYCPVHIIKHKVNIRGKKLFD